MSLEASKIYKMYYTENNIVLKYKDGDNDYTITIQFEDTVITLTNNLLIIILTLKKIIFIFTHY